MFTKKIKIKKEFPYPKYKKGKLLGKGGFAVVHLHQKVGKKKFIAVKTFSRQKSDSEEEFNYEIKGYSNAGVHKNVVKFLSAYTDEFDFGICLEYCAEGPLSDIFDKFNKFTEREVRDVVMQCCAGLQHLLKKKVVHRDIKPDNILVRKWFPIEVCLADLNFSKKIPSAKATTVLRTELGTKGYMAPEIADKALRNENGRYNFTVDVFALGIVAYELISNKQKPHYELSKEVLKALRKEHKEKKKFAKAHLAARHAMFEDIVTNGVTLKPREMWERVSDDAVDVVSAMVMPVPGKRPNYEDILKCPWATIEFHKPKPILGILKP